MLIFVTYIISREVTLKSIEPDRGIRGVMGAHQRLCSACAVRLWSFLCSEGHFGLPCDNSDQDA